MCNSALHLSLQEAEVDQMLTYGDLALQLVHPVPKGLSSGHNNISSPTEHEAPGHPLHAMVQQLKNERKRKTTRPVLHSGHDF
jgi:hypothetical protein